MVVQRDENGQKKEERKEQEEVNTKLLVQIDQLEQLY